MESKTLPEASRDPLQRYEPRPAIQRTNSMAIASLVCGILAWFGFPVIGAVAALYTGYRARKEIAVTGEAGAPLATAGIVLGWIHVVALALAALAVIAVLIVIALIAAHHA